MTQRIGNRPNLRQLIPAVLPSREWRGWEDLGGVIIGAPAVASWASNRLDCFVRGTNNNMYHKRRVPLITQVIRHHPPLGALPGSV